MMAPILFIMTKSLRQKALDFLSRREHSRFELAHKLKRYEGVLKSEIESLLDTLETQKLLSDARFAEAYLQSRFKKGYGPVRIVQELQVRGVSDEIVSQALQRISSQEWQASAVSVRQKKFGSLQVLEFEERVKQSQFLIYRGFTSDQVK
jgi:regulatory protein